jgi:glyoxylase-like metal-dependent hydrolase (beta-lactamase superfamily II)
MPVDDGLKGLLIHAAHAKLLPLKEHLRLVDRETEIVPGIHILPAPGHTPGHVALVVSSGREQFLYLADTVLHPILIEHADWYTAFDLLPERALETKRQLLGQASADGALVLAFHFPFPGLGHVAPGGSGWEWHPMEV